LCPNGSHLAQYDDQKIYFNGLIKFLRDVDKGTFKRDNRKFTPQITPNPDYCFL
jgi:hypothetical protein